MMGIVLFFFHFLFAEMDTAESALSFIYISFFLCKLELLISIHLWFHEVQ
jgi:hypothetical protein